jgi:drug/metabolite transporter (DMT)-like permease
MPENLSGTPIEGGDHTGRTAAITGAAWGLLAAAIAAGWLVFTRMGHERTLNGYDLVALRYGVAALLLLPLVYQQRSSLASYRWPVVTLLVLGGGFPYGLAAVWGLKFAPAAHAGALIAGTIPMFTALFSVAFLAQRLRSRQALGLALTVVGAGAIGGLGVATGFGEQSIGHVLFLVGAMLWSIYTVTLRKFGVPPLQATALVCVWSALIYLPIYPVAFGSAIATAPLSELLFQALYQGVLAGVVFFVAFNRSVQVLGSSGGAVFLAMVPILAALFAIPVLGEYPGIGEVFGIVAATTGVYLVTGARLHLKSVVP